MTADADFYALELLLDDRGPRRCCTRVRAFMEKEVAPIINRYWTRAEFPFESCPALRELGIAGLPYAGYGCPGRSSLLDGMVAMELARDRPVDRHLQRRAQRAGDGLDLPVRLRGAEAALAAGRWRAWRRSAPSG